MRFRTYAGVFGDAIYADSGSVSERLYSEHALRATATKNVAAAEPLLRPEA